MRFVPPGRAAPRTAAHAPDVRSFNAAMRRLHRQDSDDDDDDRRPCARRGTKLVFFFGEGTQINRRRASTRAAGPQYRANAPPTPPTQAVLVHARFEEMFAWQQWHLGEHGQHRAYVQFITDTDKTYRADVTLVVHELDGQPQTTSRMLTFQSGTTPLILRLYTITAGAMQNTFLSLFDDLRDFVDLSRMKESTFQPIENRRRTQPAARRDGRRSAARGRRRPRTRAPSCERTSQTANARSCAASLAASARAAQSRRARARLRTPAPPPGAARARAIAVAREHDAWKVSAGRATRSREGARAREV